MACAECAGFDDPFVSHVREYEALHADETRAASVRHRHRRQIGARQNLNPQRQRHSTPNFDSDRGHGRHDLRPHGALEVWPVVRVFNDHTLKPCPGVRPCLGDGRFFDLGDSVTAPRRARQSPDVNHSDQRPRNVEDRLDDSLRVQVLPFYRDRPSVLAGSRESVRIGGVKSAYGRPGRS